MKRLFEQHQVRTTQSLDGFWDFAADRDGHVGKTSWLRRFPSRHERMHVPGCWDTQPRWFDWHGRAYYRRKVRVPERGHVLITLDGAGGATRVSLDGRLLGGSPLLHLPQRLLARDVAPGEHELVVEVNTDKKLEEVFPQYGCDWHHYGGLTRPASAAFLGDVWIRDLFVHYAIERGRVCLEPEVVIENLGRRDLKETLRLELGGEEIGKFEVRLPAGRTTTVRRALAPRKLGLWSPDDPKLHLLRASCGGDDLAERVGLRTIAVADRRLLLNGEPIRLLGVNRHHEYGDHGFAVPADIVQRDFELIREMGCNAVRCHYPVDALAMDFMDEMGLLYWADLPFYGRWKSVVGNPAYLALAERGLEEAARAEFNHPSVIVRGLLNECATEVPGGMLAARRLVKKGRAVDPTRLMSLSSNRLLTERSLPLFDLVGLNSYPGWYDNKEFLDWPKLLPAMRRAMRKKGLGRMPIVVTETGAAGIYGDRSLEDRKWTEGFQERLLEKHLRYLLANDDVTGVFVWQFADARTVREYWTNRPGTVNNKGLLDRFRRPKDAYWKVREIYQQARRRGGHR